MTVAADIAALGDYNSTKITNIVAVTFKQLSLYAGEPIAETEDEDWDTIAVNYGIYLLDRQTIQERAKTEPTLTVPPIMPDFIQELIDKSQSEEVTDPSLFVNVTSFRDDRKHWNRKRNR